MGQQNWSVNQTLHVWGLGTTSSCQPDMCQLQITTGARRHFPWMVRLWFSNCWTQASQHLTFFWQNNYWNSSIFDLKHTDGKQSEEPRKIETKWYNEFVAKLPSMEGGTRKARKKTGWFSNISFWMKDSFFSQLSGVFGAWWLTFHPERWNACFFQYRFFIFNLMHLWDQ